MGDAFHERLIEAERELLARADGHDLFRGAAANDLDEPLLESWLAQEYLWLRDYEHFLAEMAARAPHGIRRPLLDALLALHGDAELTEEFAVGKGISQHTHRPTFATHA
ncbi:MAG: hypothetical protein GF346_00700, partial [Candidatus Eisenbacteria bacterium]|nr:hypothetical protein [Candidatus Latescibacterota bacterium]MBD3300950.1 hypothetical protein [Candidatus Eisenbacteria bacterium]